MKYKVYTYEGESDYDGSDIWYKRGTFASRYDAEELAEYLDAGGEIVEIKDVEQNELPT